VSDELGITIPWDGKVYEVSADVVGLIKIRTGRTGKFTVRVAHAVANKLKDHPQRHRLLRDLYVYAMFEGDLRSSELTWLSCQIGGNEVRSIATAAKKRQERRKAA
jgi:hypothetical protein